MHTPGELLSILEKVLLAEKIVKDPQHLYDPVNYILGLGGKRIRPLMAMMACEMFDGEIENVMPAALGIEMFHNFSLVHDDIMDRAPLRRGNPTVHQKWDTNAAILSGDTMLVLAYEYFLRLDEPLIKKVIAAFSQTAREVCEGQQYDMNFETNHDISLDDYMEMIRLKTAVLIGASFQIGSMIAGANEEDIQQIYDFGVNAGMAFQLMDDLLDTYGDEKEFGKMQFGDIHTNKKTFLYMKALEMAEKNQAEILTYYYSGKNSDPEEKVREVIRIFDALNVRHETEQMISRYHDLARLNLSGISVNGEKKKIILDFTEKLMARKF